MATKMTEKKIAKIKALRKQKLSERAIAKKVGCSRSAVNYQLNK
ncbi:MAG: hypothetical protein PHO56_02135 [Patescibacteria group bacterium]|nr:hypothetical protein [Patescibacteria group bacterium]